MNRLQSLRRPLGSGLALFSLALFAALAQGAQAPAPAHKGVTIEGITEYRLDNGLRVLLFPDESTPNVTVNLTVLVGSRHEGYGETGMAHLLEHMLFKGTPTHKTIPKLLKDRGATYNATTAYDRTNFFETLAGTEDNLEFALRLEADRFVNSLVQREDLASEMTVVRSEFEMYENSPEAILRQRMMAVAYEWHNYGKMVIGNRSDIERVPIDRLQAFYHKYYRPDNAVLIVAGKFKPDTALQFVRKYFAPLKRPKVKLETTYTEEPPQDGERTVVLRRVGKVGLVGAMYHVPAAAHPDYAPLEVLADVLDVAPAGRLYKSLVETRKATRVNCYTLGGFDPGLFMVQVTLGADGAAAAVRDQMLALVEKAGQENFTNEEVERIKRKFRADREKLMANSNQVATTLTEWAAHGDWRLFFLHRDRIAKVTPADVKRVAAKYLVRSNRTVGAFIPTEAGDIVRARVPEAPSVADLVKDYKSSETVAQGEEFDPTPANIEKRVKRSRIGKGVQVAILPRKSRGNTVTAQLTLRYGNEKSLTGNTIASRLLGTLMLRGTKKHDRQELQDELDKLKATLTPAAGLGQLTFTLTTTQANLPAAVRLLGEVLREPTFPEKELDLLKRSIRVSLEQGLTDPHNLSVRALQRRLKPYPATDVRYTPTIPESLDRLKALTRDQVAKLYADQVGADHAELAIVGDFDPEPVLKEFEGALAGWKAKAPFARIAEPAQTDVAGAREQILTPDKKNAFYLAGLMFALSDTDPDYPALVIGNYIFGTNGLSSRLGNRVRQKEGLSYFVGSNFSADARDKAAAFTMIAVCNPANIDKVNRAIAEELARFLKDGVDDRELVDAKQGYLQQLKQEWSRDSGLANHLADGLYEGRTFTFYADYQKKINALTPEAVRKAFQKHIQPKRLIVIEAGDLNKKAVKSPKPAK
jgi:zinc protease